MVGSGGPGARTVLLWNVVVPLGATVVAEGGSMRGGGSCCARSGGRRASRARGPWARNGHGFCAPGAAEAKHQ